jgi:hypothetical protein
MDYTEITKEEAAKSVEGGLVVFLGSCGNPDHGQDPSRPPYGAAKNRLASASSLKMASMICREFIDENELGGGNWIGGTVFNATSGERIATISYNGRIWEQPAMSAEEVASIRQGKNVSFSDMVMLKDVARLAKTQAPAVLNRIAQLVAEAPAQGKTAARPRPKG